jgi:hypothetical protein
MLHLEMARSLRNHDRMPKRSSTDANLIAARIVEISTGQPLKREKNAAAVALGKLGGMKGGRARADKLTEEKRRDIAQRAAKQRWAKAKGGSSST